MGRNIFWRFTIALFLTSFICSAEEELFHTEELRIDWEQQHILLHLSVDIPEDLRDNPSAEFLLRQRIDPMLHAPLKEVIMPIKIDSRRTIAEWSEGNLHTQEPIDNFLTSARLMPSSLTEDFSRVSLIMVLDLYPQLSSLFAPSVSMLPLRREMAWRPSGDFTGLVIYAADMLSLYGTDRQSYLEPALLPEIYTTDITPVLSYTELDPDALHFWGMALYTHTEKEDPQRVGLNPLRIIAVGIFGKYATDPIISDFDAAVILQSHGLREALQQGRIQIIVQARDAQ